MVLINKQPKRSCHMASMPINDRRLIKLVIYTLCCDIERCEKPLRGFSCQAQSPHFDLVYAKNKC